MQQGNGSATWIDSPREIARFRRRLVSWGHKNLRQFPWRSTRNPYYILLAEVMLHRTQAKQVLPVYEEFVRQYRDIASLALASKKGLRRTLYSLGLQWRIDLIHRMAQELDTRFSGQVPRDKDALLSLPGVSEYIAAAVRCFAWNEPEAIIDTNTVRVIGRVFGLEIKPSSRRNPQFRTILKKLVDPKHPKLYNYALLDLADKVCTIKRPPDCPQCPLVQMCIYGKAMM